MKTPYKYLKKRDSAFIRFAKCCFKWTKVYCGIFVIFAVGLVLFINFVDGKSQSNKKNPLNDNDIANTNAHAGSLEENFDELSKHELDLLEKNFDNIDDCDDISKKEFEKELYDFSDWNRSCPPELIIVNKKNPLDSNFKPNLKLCRGKQVSVLISEKLENLIHDAYKDGVFLWIVSGYRTFDHQKYLFDRRIDKIFQKFAENNQEISLESAEKIAEKIVQKPLQSEHNTGLAVDFNDVTGNFKNTKEYAWLHENAYKYGFIERYQENWESTTGVIAEPWHLRYVGLEAAETIKNSDICLEQYVKQRLNLCKKC